MSTQQQKLDALYEAQSGRPNTREWPLSPEIDFYLRGLARRSKRPLRVRDLRVRPPVIADQVVAKLKSLEQDLLGPREELAAHEFGYAHPGHSALDIGRGKLAHLIAYLIEPLAAMSDSDDLILNLEIGKNPVEPLTEDGLRIHATAESRNKPEAGTQAVLRRRFTTQRTNDLLTAGQDIEVGLVLVCRPGRMDADQTNDDISLHKFLRADRPGNDIFALGANLMQAIQHEKESGDKHGATERESLQQSMAALSTFLLILWDEERMTEADHAKFVAAGIMGTSPQAMPYDATLPPDAIPYLDEVERSIEALKDIPPALGVELERFQEAIVGTFSATNQHAAAQPQDNQDKNQPPVQKRETLEDTEDFEDSNNDGIVDWKQPEAFAPLSELLALAANNVTSQEQQKPAGPSEPAGIRNNATHPLRDTPQPQDS